MLLRKSLHSVSYLCIILNCAENEYKENKNNKLIIVAHDDVIHSIHSFVRSFVRSFIQIHFQQHGPWNS